MDMMRDVISGRGTASSVNSRLKFKSDWAGKTGTGNQYYDAWFVATNPNVSFGIWTGYDTPKSLKSGGLNYSLRNIYLWADLINAAYDINPDLIDPAETFQMPEGIVTRSYCAVSGLIPSDACSRAGLVETDLFNAKYAPTKVDDSFIQSKYVQIGDSKYLALDSTPAEFASTGVMLNFDYVTKILGTSKGVSSQLIPKKDRWANILVPDAKIAENGKIPSPLAVSLSGGNLVWSPHPDSDIIGYRLYKQTASGIQKVSKY